MLISIITATFNSADYIEDTYQSIRSQTYYNWEWLVTDDASTDNSWQILTTIARLDSRVKIFRLVENSGAAVARNNSLSNSSGEFIAFIDSDDLWFHNKIETQLDSLNANDIDFSFTPYELVNSSGISLNKKIDLNKFGSYSYFDLLKKKITLGCSTVMLRKSAFPEISFPLIRTGQDYALWLNLLKSGNCANICPFVLTKYRITPGSISRNKIKKAARQWSIYRDLEGINLFKSIYYFTNYALRAILR